MGGRNDPEGCQIAAKRNPGNDLLLLLTAAIWGFAFVAQRKGMESLDPFTFNGIRFALGAVALALLSRFLSPRDSRKEPFPLKLGLLLFVAASLQQAGMLFTTAGNAGFITGLYVVFVPLLGLFRGQKPSTAKWISVLISVLGLWLLNHGQPAQISLGNGIVLLSAVFWAAHVQMIDYLANRYSALKLAIGQFSVCAILSTAIGIVWQGMGWNGAKLTDLPEQILTASIPLLYGGLMSVAIAYTLQIYAQKRTAPLPAAIILSLEGVFALGGGWLLLGESITLTVGFGAALMLSAVVLNNALGNSKSTSPAGQS